MAVGTKLEKAHLILKDPTSGRQVGGLQLQFNPKEYSIQKSASWESKPAKGAKKTAMPEFKGAEPRSMTLEVFLDATISPKAAKDGTPPPPEPKLDKDIEELFKCCTPTPGSLSKNKPSPPFVAFGWGNTVLFEAFVKQVSVKYTLFKPDGTPIRATASLTLQELPRDSDKQNPTSGGLGAHGTHTVVAGDTLASIAYEEYGDPRLWRAVAEANAVDDPMRLRTGLTLLIPPPEAAALHT
jgi:nucleoid-associated protein YgaU